MSKIEEPLVIVPDYEVSLDELYEDDSILNQQIRDDLEALIEDKNKKEE